MPKNLPLVIVIAVGVIIAVAGIYYYLAGQIPQLPQIMNPLSQKTEKLMLEQDLTPLELSAEEQQALKEQGLSMPSGTDSQTEKLQTVNQSDDLSAMEKDIEGTDTSNMDPELNQIDQNLQ